MRARHKHTLVPLQARDKVLLWPLLLLVLGLGAGFIVFSSLFVVPQKIHGIGLLLLKGDLKQILSPFSGTIETWLKEEGDSIKIDEPVAKIKTHEENKAQTVHAKISGILGEIIAYPDTVVTVGQSLAIVTNEGDPRKDLELVGFVSSLEGKKIKAGMQAFIRPSVVNAAQEGYMRATVKRVGKLPMSKAAIQSIIKIPEVVKYIRGQIEAEPFVVNLNPLPDPTHITGYSWTGPGPSFELDSGIIADIFVVNDEPTVLEMLWPSFFKRGAAN